MRRILFVVGACLFLLSLSGRQSHAQPKAGAILIADEPDYWGFIWEEMQAMRADVMKFHLSYDHHWEGGMPAHFVIPSAHLQGAISNGATDLIVRTAETHITAKEVRHFVEGMTFFDTGERLVDFIYNNRDKVHVWIEVGNEPDQHRADPWVHRYNLIDTWNQLKPQWEWLWNMHWIASAPLACSGTYTDVFYHKNHEGSVQDKYEAIGVHEYGDFNFDFKCTDRAKREISSGHSIWVTEAGINHDYDWAQKGRRYRNALSARGWPVRGWTFFLLTKVGAYPWNHCPTSDGNCHRYAMDLHYNSDVPVPGRPAATELGKR